MLGWKIAISDFPKAIQESLVGKIARQLRYLGMVLRSDGELIVYSSLCTSKIEHNMPQMSCKITTPNGTTYNLQGVNKVTKRHRK